MNIESGEPIPRRPAWNIDRDGAQGGQRVVRPLSELSRRGHPSESGLPDRRS